MTTALNVIFQEHIDRVVAAVDAGNLTAAEGTELLYEVALASGGGALSTAATPAAAPAPTTRPPVAAPVTHTDQQLLVAALKRSSDSDADVLRTLAQTPPEELASIASKERARTQARSQAAVDAQWAASSEGLAVRATEIRAANAAREAQLLDANTLLAASGFTPHDLENLTDSEKLTYSGVNPDPDAGAAKSDRGFARSNMIQPERASAADIALLNDPPTEES